ncbi:MAG: hypothetical protein IPL39_20440 [Opitutaceae bacterium]|nr:hypothetical protein [Opitutaceae bacterium]
MFYQSGVDNRLFINKERWVPGPREDYKDGCLWRLRPDYYAGDLGITISSGIPDMPFTVTGLTDWLTIRACYIKEYEYGDWIPSATLPTNTGPAKSVLILLELSENSALDDVCSPRTSDLNIGSRTVTVIQDGSDNRFRVSISSGTLNGVYGGVLNCTVASLVQNSPFEVTGVPDWLQVYGLYYATPMIEIRLSPMALHLVPGTSPVIFL